MKLIKLIFFLSLFFHTISLADINIEFENWKKNFKKIALKNKKMTMSQILTKYNSLIDDIPVFFSFTSA